jgi:hypothetical protein
MWAPVLVQRPLRCRKQELPEWLPAFVNGRSPIPVQQVPESSSKKNRKSNNKQTKTPTPSSQFPVRPQPHTQSFLTMKVVSPPAAYVKNARSHWGLYTEPASRRFATVASSWFQTPTCRVHRCIHVCLALCRVLPCSVHKGPRRSHDACQATRKRTHSPTPVNIRHPQGIAGTIGQRRTLADRRGAMQQTTFSRVQSSALENGE